MLSKATGKLVNFGRKQHRKASPRIPASGMRNSPDQSPDSGDFYAAAKAWQLESDCVHRGRPIEWSTQIMRLRQQIFSPSTAHTVGADDGGKCTLGTSSFQGRRHEKIADHCEPISLDWWPHVDENTCNRVAFPPFPPPPPSKCRVATAQLPPEPRCNTIVDILQRWTLDAYSATLRLRLDPLIYARDTCRVLWPTRAQLAES